MVDNKANGNVTEYQHDGRKPGSHDYISVAVVEKIVNLPGKKVLDIGCGNGWLCRSMADAGYEVYGLDASDTGIEHAKKLVPEGTFLVESIDEHTSAFGNEYFDIVVSTEVIEHLYDPEVLLRLTRKSLKPGGHVVITTPYHGYLKNLLISVFDKWDHHHQCERHGGHIKFFSRSSLVEMLKKNNLEITSFSGLGRMHWLWKSMLVVSRKRG